MDNFMRSAIDEALKGRAEGGIPIGSVLVKHGKIVGRGRNKRVQENNPILCAEIDCLQNAGRNDFTSAADISCRLSVQSNEPPNGPGDGNASPDWAVLDAHHVRLRAERAGNGTGRVYSITITCTYLTRNSSSKSMTVTVPHDQK